MPGAEDVAVSPPAAADLWFGGAGAGVKKMLDFGISDTMAYKSRRRTGMESHCNTAVMQAANLQSQPGFKCPAALESP